jgi:hypothetical protein
MRGSLPLLGVAVRERPKGSPAVLRGGLASHGLVVSLVLTVFHPSVCVCVYAVLSRGCGNKKIRGAGHLALLAADEEASEALEAEMR